jgi:hypothetical protein
MLVTTDTEICNLALAHLGISKTIADDALLTERSKNAQACRAFIESVRHEVLRDYPWQFATAFAELVLVEEEPTIEWPYAYRGPENSMFLRRILNGVSRHEISKTRVKFRQVADLVSTTYDAATEYATGDYVRSVDADDVVTWYRSLEDVNEGNTPLTSPDEWVAITGGPPKIIYTDLEDPVAEYTALITDPRQYTADFVQAMALLLAAYIAPRSTGDNEKLGIRAANLYIWRMGKAQANDSNERQVDADPESDFINSRN